MKTGASRRNYKLFYILITGSPKYFVFWLFTFNYNLHRSNQLSSFQDQRVRWVERDTVANQPCLVTGCFLL